MVFSKYLCTFQIIFCFGDNLDHPVIALFSIIPKAKYTVIHEYHPAHFIPINIFGHSCYFFCQDKSRHHIRNDQYIITINFIYFFSAIWCISNGQDRICMGMVHKGKWNKSMQNGFNRRVWS